MSSLTVTRRSPTLARKPSVFRQCGVSCAGHTVLRFWRWAAPSYVWRTNTLDAAADKDQGGYGDEVTSNETLLTANSGARIRYRRCRDRSLTRLRVTVRAGGLRARSRNQFVWREPEGRTEVAEQFRGIHCPQNPSITQIDALAPKHSHVCRPGRARAATLEGESVTGTKINRTVHRVAWEWRQRLDIGRQTTRR